MYGWDVDIVWCCFWTSVQGQIYVGKNMEWKMQWNGKKTNCRNSAFNPSKQQNPPKGEIVSENGYDEAYD